MKLQKSLPITVLAISWLVSASSNAAQQEPIAEVAETNNLIRLAVPHKETNIYLTCYKLGGKRYERYILDLEKKSVYQVRVHCLSFKRECSISDGWLASLRAAGDEYRWSFYGVSMFGEPPKQVHHSINRKSLALVSSRTAQGAYCEVKNRNSFIFDLTDEAKMKLMEFQKKDQEEVSAWISEPGHKI